MNLIEATVPDLSFLCAGLSSRIPLRNASAALGGPWSIAEVLPTHIV
jgi:hypothetical protein